jgi:hypothetical protein
VAGAGVTWWLWTAGAIAAAALILYRRRRRLWRWIVEQFLEDLKKRVFTVPGAFDNLANTLAIAVTPHVGPLLASAAGVVDPVALRAVFAGAGRILAGAPPALVAIAPYTAAQMDGMATGVADTARAVLGSYQLKVPVADVERLLGAVAERVVAVPA